MSTHAVGGASLLLFSTSVNMHSLCELCLFFSFFLGSCLCQERCSPAATPLLPWILPWFALTLSHPPKPSKSRNRGMGSCRLSLLSHLLAVTHLLDLRGCCGVFKSVSPSMIGEYSGHNLQSRKKENFSSPFQTTSNKHLSGSLVASDTSLMKPKCSKL